MIFSPKARLSSVDNELLTVFVFWKFCPSSDTNFTFNPITSTPSAPRSIANKDKQIHRKTSRVQRIIQHCIVVRFSITHSLNQVSNSLTTLKFTALKFLTHGANSICACTQCVALDMVFRFQFHRDLLRNSAQLDKRAPQIPFQNLELRNMFVEELRR